VRNFAHVGARAWIWIGLLATAAVAQGTLPSPFSARVKMADGRMVSVRIEGWMPMAARAIRVGCSGRT